MVNLITGEVEQRGIERLRHSSSAATWTLEERAESLERHAASLASSPDLVSTLEAGNADAAARQAFVGDDVDIAVISRPGAESDQVAASFIREPDFAGTVDVPSDRELLTRRGDIAITAATPLPGGRRLVIGQWIDNFRLRALPRVDAVDFAIVSGDQVVSSTGGLGDLPNRPLEGEFETELGGREALVSAGPVPGADAVLVVAVRPPGAAGQTNLILILGALLVVMIVLIVLVGYVVSGLITRPLQDVVEAALAVSRGDLDQHVDARGDREVAALGTAFNRMTENLREQVRQLEESRTDFRQAIARLGDVLVSTHDLSGIIDVVLEACALTMRAEQAVFYERVAMPARIRARAAHPGDVSAVELNGTGIAGLAARRLSVASLPGPDPLDPVEPAVSAAAAVPVLSEGRLFGVLAVYGKPDGEFRPEDLDTLQTLARQAEVAIGNVMLHDETRRQARTDGLTGMWNRREFELRARDAVREADRFNEPFGMVVVDIDDFKIVNDEYDHTTGDAALVWLAARLDEATREVDLVARWGGEEFIVLLPRAGVHDSGVVAERIRRAVARVPMEHDGHIIPLTVSVGYACYPDDGRNQDELFRAADAALLRAKRLGKNRVERARSDEGAA